MSFAMSAVPIYSTVAVAVAAGSVRQRTTPSSFRLAARVTGSARGRVSNWVTDIDVTPKQILLWGCVGVRQDVYVAPVFAAAPLGRLGCVDV